MMNNPMMDRINGHRTFDGGEGFGGGRCRGGFGPEGFGNRRRYHRDFNGEGFGPHAMPRDGFGDFGPHAMPRDSHGDFGPHAMPRGGFGGEDGYRTMPGGPGFPPHGRPPFGGPGGIPPRGGRPPHDLPPRRPNPEFLKRRVEEADLGELLDMAQRLSRRRPQGNPARSQALILSILAGREALSQRELQQMLGIQPGSLSEVLSKLEAKGLLTREKAEDRRGNLLRITDAGRGAMTSIDDAPEDDPFAPLSPDQQDQLSDLLRTLLNAWVDRLEPAPVPQCGQKPVEV